MAMLFCFIFHTASKIHIKLAYHLEQYMYLPKVNKNLKFEITRIFEIYIFNF
jgi:hypothetical protein